MSHMHRGRRLMHAMDGPFRVDPRVRWFEFMKARMAVALSAKRSAESMMRSTRRGSRVVCAQ